MTNRHLKKKKKSNTSFKFAGLVAILNKVFRKRNIL